MNEPEADLDVQIRELQRLMDSTSDPEKRLTLKQQLHDLMEEASLLTTAEPNAQPKSPERRKSFRPVSAKPRHLTLSTLTEENDSIAELSSSNFSCINSSPTSSFTNSPLAKTFASTACEFLSEDQLMSLVTEVSSSCHDENHQASFVLEQSVQRFWFSTGGFPQFVSLALVRPVKLALVEVACRNVERLVLHTKRVAKRRSSLPLQLSQQQHHQQMQHSKEEKDSKATTSSSTTTAASAITTAAATAANDAITIDIPVSMADMPSLQRFPLQEDDPVDVLELFIASGHADFVAVYFFRLKAARAEEIIATSLAGIGGPSKAAPRML